jgi:hypothetical protein
MENSRRFGVERGGAFNRFGHALPIAFRENGPRARSSSADEVTGAGKAIAKSVSVLVTAKFFQPDGHKIASGCR